MATPVTIIGIGDDGADGLFPQALLTIREADVLVGGERHLAFFPDSRAEKVIITSGLKSVIEQIEQAIQDKRRVVVLASGDPLFYGIGSLLTRKLDKSLVSIIPHFSSVQLAFARMKENAHDAYVDSVHGRPMQGLVQRIDGKAKVALLTDNVHTPAAVARYLLSYGVDEYEAFVAERLGSAEERCRWFSLSELAEAECDPLSVLILRRKPGVKPPHWPLGIPDDAFLQRKPDKGLITKREVRVVSLAEMNLRADSIVWDIGTATGSVAIEAARIARLGQVYAVEKNAPDVENAIANARHFRADITIVHARAPEGLDAFPDPDAVFIGGSGGELAELIALCARRLRDGGRIVLNAATIETLHDAMQACRANGLAVSVTLVQVSRSKPILNLTRLEALNPVYIVTAKKQPHLSQEEELIP